MALFASASAGNPVMAHEGIDDALDNDIAQVRAEIENLTRRRKVLASSLISSSMIQDRLTAASSANRAEEPSSAQIASAIQQSSFDTHRLGIGVVSFPFNDPSPEMQSKNPLLGIQIDICDRAGRFDSPYYLFCVRAGDVEGPASQEFRIHRHTIPASVQVQEYEKQYLPLPDEGYGSENSVSSSAGGSRRQDLYGLVDRIRHDLVAWRLRQDAIEAIREQLGLPTKKPHEHLPGSYTDASNKEHQPDEERGEHVPIPDVEAPVGRFGVREFEATGVDARQVRILWSDDRLGRIKVSDTGRIDKAAVFGSEGHMRDTERVLTEGDATVFDLFDRLQEVDLGTRAKKGTEKTRRSRP